MYNLLNTIQNPHYKIFIFLIKPEFTRIIATFLFLYISSLYNVFVFLRRLIILISQIIKLLKEFFISAYYQSCTLVTAINSDLRYFLFRNVTTNFS